MYRALKLLGKTAQPQIILPPVTTLTLYDYIYFENSTTNGAKFRKYTRAQNINKKPSKTWLTMCYRVSNKQKLSTIPARECNDCIWASLVQLVS